MVGRRRRKPGSTTGSRNSGGALNFRCVSWPIPPPTPPPIPPPPHMYATLCAVYLGLQEYKEGADAAHITKAILKTDGAAAYAGVVFTKGIAFLSELIGVRILAHFTGEAGKGKLQLDGNFGCTGEALRRLISANLHDVKTPTDLYEALTKVLKSGSSAQLFSVDRTDPFSSATIQSLSVMSHRAYEYDATTGAFLGLRLRRQSWLGAGLYLSKAELFPKDQKAPAKPNLVRSTAAAAAGSSSSDAAAPKGVARNDEGRAELKKKMTAAKAAREEKRGGRQAKLEDYLRRWREQSSTHRCADAEDGCPGCAREFLKLSNLRRHIAAARLDPKLHRNADGRPAAGASSSAHESMDVEEEPPVHQTPVAMEEEEEDGGDDDEEMPDVDDDEEEATALDDEPSDDEEAFLTDEDEEEELDDSEEEED